MIPTISRDHVTFSRGELHTNFRRTGVTKTAQIMAISPPVQFEITSADGSFSLNAGETRLELFAREQLAIEAMARVTTAVAADPEGKWVSRKRYTMLVAGAFLAVSLGASMLNYTGPTGAASTAGLSPIPNAVAATRNTAAAPPSDMAGAGTPPLRRAIHFGKAGAPADKTLYVFSDPQCPHCRDLERALVAMPADYSIYVFPTPFLPGAAEITAKVNCSDDPKKAWREAVAGQPISGTGNCDKSGWGKENVDFFRATGLTATPTLVAGADGRIRTGATDTKTLVEWMRAAQ